MGHLTQLIMRRIVLQHIPWSKLQKSSYQFRNDKLNQFVRRVFIVEPGGTTLGQVNIRTAPSIAQTEEAGFGVGENNQPKSWGEALYTVVESVSTTIGKPLLVEAGGV